MDPDVTKNPRTIEHAETTHDAPTKSDAAVDAATRGQLATGYEHLSDLETIKTFELCTFVCFAIAFSAATDGYQIGINASIIANKGFVAQFATDSNDDGSPALASPILSGWSYVMSIGQIIGMTTLPFISSRYGRKIVMITYWLILCGSVIAECVTRSWQSCTVPTYISEVAPVRIRGGLLMAYSLWWTLGSFFSQVALQHISQSSATDYLAPIYTQWAQLGLMLVIYLLMLLRFHRGVKDYDVDHQVHVLYIAAEHERAIAIEQRREKCFGTYFFQQPGMDDPFKIKVITSSIQIGTVLVLVTVVDWTGRKLLACGGTTLSWLSCVAIGIIGVVPQVKTSTYVFVLFACLWNVGMAANGATGWGYAGEISSQRLRPYTTGWSYAGVGFPFALGMWFLIPETAG
ncbi:hypothetical protein BDW59DRAFT_179737 [Aspergillus cavernicola]|uniref:Major facilitator superfamily (MFS) profile domain-containing protein n=1 Tax=Aspergillus cavernicola TaxID=176166 RepID=A0ABR4IE00_9EURO